MWRAERCEAGWSMPGFSPRSRRRRALNVLAEMAGISPTDVNEEPGNFLGYNTPAEGTMDHADRSAAEKALEIRPRKSGWATSFAAIDAGSQRRMR